MSSPPDRAAEAFDALRADLTERLARIEGILQSRPEADDGDEVDYVHILGRITEEVIKVRILVETVASSPPQSPQDPGSELVMALRETRRLLQQSVSLSGQIRLAKQQQRQRIGFAVCGAIAGVWVWASIGAKIVEAAGAFWFWIE